jgi:hypothetical protein
MARIDPINYWGMLPEISLGDSLLKGAQATAIMSQARQREQALLQARQREEQYRRDLTGVLDAPSAEGFARLTAMYPEQREAFKQSWDALSAEQQKAELGAASRVFGALNANRPDMAEALLTERIEALKNANQPATEEEGILEIIRTDPNRAKGYLGVTLASIVGPEKFAESFGKIGGELREQEMAPAQLSEAQSKAQKAAVDAKFAESQAALDLQKRGWDITKIQEDIKIARENSRIAAINASISRESNDLKRAELAAKLAEAQEKRDAALREKVATVESASASMDNMLNTADRILSTPASVIRAATGPISTRTPTLSQDTADFEELVNTMSSQAFLAMIPTFKGGGGAGADAEGAKLQQALQNLSLRQSPERLLENVREAQRLILKGRSSLARKHGLPETVPDTPAARGGPSSGGKSTDEILRELGVVR